ncbi:unnamed protein product [Dracunculus medinensis]|uniref:Endo/exonuclease/phosphatase domain-containing protein n=1 Tax=Dracunculus medinensis TaxID=318479 RepID=A0A0N4UPK7_DRAME|nr:unnamed protein product [Dracunculus medinensis]
MKGTALCTRCEVSAVSAWNVRILMDVASHAITIHTLSKYCVDIACSSEVRLPIFGLAYSRSRSIINPGSEQKYWLYDCGGSNNLGRNGVAIVMSDKAHSALIEWKLTVWPTPRFKDKFYAELQLLTRPLRKHDMVIIGGDWNACVGHNAAAMTLAIGKYAIADRCCNGERFLHCAKEHYLFVTNTCFRHHRKHLIM